MRKKAKRGGKRKGAGRPRQGGELIYSLFLGLDEKQGATLKRIAKREGLPSLQAAIRWLIDSAEVE